MKRAGIFVTGIALAALIAAVPALPIRAQGQPLQGPKIPLPEQPRQPRQPSPAKPAPTRLTATPRPPDSVWIEWTCVEGATEYLILAAAGQAALAPVGRVDPVCTYAPSAGGPGPISGFGEKPQPSPSGQAPPRKSFIHAGVPAAMLMKYVVRAVHPGGYSDSQAVTAAIGKPFQPKNVRTRELMMTGLRFQPKSVTTDELTMTGLREPTPGEPIRREAREPLGGRR